METSKCEFRETGGDRKLTGQIHVKHGLQGSDPIVGSISRSKLTDVYHAHQALNVER